MENKNYTELTIDWAEGKGLNKPSMLPGQLLKTIEEITEIGEAVTEFDRIDAIGDSRVTLIITGHQVGIKTAVGFPRTILGIMSARALTKARLDLLETVGRIGGVIGRLSLEEADKVGLPPHAVDEIEEYLYEANGLLEAIAHYFELNVDDCLGVAYDVISGRKGLTIDGIFVKYEDLSPENKAIVDAQ